MKDEEREHTEQRGGAPNQPRTVFESEASEAGLATEFWEFLAHNKKYWMLPIIVALFLIGLLVFLSSTAATPFIYTLF